jgi:hypothetical protein
MPYFSKDNVVRNVVFALEAKQGHALRRGRGEAASRLS